MIKKMREIGGRELDEEKGGKKRPRRRKEDEWRKMRNISRRSLAKGR